MIPFTARSALLPLVAAALTVSPFPLQEHGESAQGNIDAALARVAVVGASLSDGCGLELELENRATLAEVLNCLLKTGRASSFSDTYFFVDPRMAGTQLCSQAAETDPSLVIGLDLLLWFALGKMKSDQPEQERESLFEEGLAMLQCFKCPLILGDIPDLTPALAGVGPFGTPLITEDMLPLPATLEKLNKRLASWAEERGDVRIVPISTYLRQVVNGEELRIRDRTMKLNVELFMQPDMLHPTLLGSVTLVRLALSDASPESFRWEDEEIEVDKCFGLRPK